MAPSNLLKNAPRFLISKYGSINKYIHESLIPIEKIEDVRKQFKTKEERRIEFRRLRDISDEASFVAFIFILKKSFNDGSTAAKNAVDTFRDLHVNGFKIGSKLFSGRNKNVLQGDVLAEALVASIKDSRVRALIQKSTYLSEIVEEYKKVISIRPNG